MSKNENREDGLTSWKISNGQNYLEIFAPNHYQLGVLEGYHLSNQIKSFKKVIKIFFLLTNK